MSAMVQERVGHWIRLKTLPLGSPCSWAFPIGPADFCLFYNPELWVGGVGQEKIKKWLISFFLLCG